MALLSFIKVTFRIVPSAKGGEDKLNLYIIYLYIYIFIYYIFIFEYYLNTN